METLSEQLYCGLLLKEYLTEHLEVTHVCKKVGASVLWAKLKIGQNIPVKFRTERLKAPG